MEDRGAGASGGSSPSSSQATPPGPPPHPRLKRPRTRAQAARAAMAPPRARAHLHPVLWLVSREAGAWPAGRTRRAEAVERWGEGYALSRLDAGAYLEMDQSRAMVRSTICIAFSHDGRYFASTHGDHTVKVFQYPEKKQVAVLEGHPRTPWTVRFHPSQSYIIASGCLGKRCKVWDVRTGKCLYQCLFGSPISCISFHPSGLFLAVTSGKSLELWEYASDAHPKKMREGGNPFHMVDFHPSGEYILTGEKNEFPHDGSDSQFTLRLVLNRFTMEDGIPRNSEPALLVPRAIAYNDAGTHFSPCGRMLVACIPRAPFKKTFQIAVLALRSHPAPMGALLCSIPLDENHVIALTNLKFSSSSHHILAGYSFRESNPVLRNPAVPVVDVYRIGREVNSRAEHVKSLLAELDPVQGSTRGSAQDEINIAVFASGSGISDGIIYGTQKGRIRVFQHSCRPEARTGMGPGHGFDLLRQGSEFGKSRLKNVVRPSTV